MPLRYEELLFKGKKMQKSAYLGLKINVSPRTNIVFNTFMNKDEELLNIKYYAFCLDEESRRWKVIHYFDWEDGVRFYGTEAVYYNASGSVNNIWGG